MFVLPASALSLVALSEYAKKVRADEGIYVTVLTGRKNLDERDL